MTSKPEWITGMTRHGPFGLSDHAAYEVEFVSRCNRWHARRGNFGTMILTDRRSGTVHVVKGKMPEVEAFVEEIQASGTTAKSDSIQQTAPQLSGRSGE